MWSEEIRKLADPWSEEVKTYKEIGNFLNISNFKPKVYEKIMLKTRVKVFIISEMTSLPIQRECSKLNAKGVKVNCRKLI